MRQKLKGEVGVVTACASKAPLTQKIKFDRRGKRKEKFHSPSHHTSSPKIEEGEKERPMWAPTSTMAAEEGV